MVHGLQVGADDYITKPFSPVNWWPGLMRYCAAAGFHSAKRRWSVAI